MKDNANTTDNRTANTDKGPKTKAANTAALGVLTVGKVALHHKDDIAQHLTPDSSDFTTVNNPLINDFSTTPNDIFSSGNDDNLFDGGSDFSSFDDDTSW